MEQLVARLQRDLALALDSKQVSQGKCDDLSTMHEKTLRELEIVTTELATARRQAAEAQRSEETSQNDLGVALRQGAKLSKQHEQSQADVATLKADVYKLGQQLLESMNAQDDLMDQSMLLLKQRDEADEANRARDGVRKELDGLKEEHTAAREECQELRSRLAAKERLLQEQCRRMSSTGAPPNEGSGYSSSDSYSDSSTSRQRVHEMHQELVRLRKDYKTRCDECELLRQQCMVAKKERADSLNEQDSIVSRCYQLQQEMEGVQAQLANAQQSINKLNADLGKSEQNLKVAQKEKIEAQQSRDWAFEERTRIINERDTARADTTHLQQSRDKAVSDHVTTMRDADNLRHELDNVTRDLHSARALKDMYSTQLNAQAHYWQADYITKEVAMRKGIDAQLGFTIGGGQDHPDPKLGPVIQVVEVLDEGPAYDILKCDDLLVMINNQDLTNVTQATAAQMLREASSPLKIVLRRRGVAKVEATPFEILLQGSRDYGIQLESHIVVTGLTANSIVGNKVQAGDRILMVDSMLVTNMDIGRVTHSIKATKRSNPIKLTLLRPTAVSGRRPYVVHSGRRPRSMGNSSGNNSAAGAPTCGTGTTASSLGVVSLGDSISNTMPSNGERLSLDDDAPSSGHGTLDSGERSTPSIHDRTTYPNPTSHRTVLSSVHSVSSGSGDRVGGLADILATVASASNADFLIPAGPPPLSSAQRSRRRAAAMRDGNRSSGGSSGQGVEAAICTTTSTAPTATTAKTAPTPNTATAPAAAAADADIRSAKEASDELQPLLESVQQGEKRLQALQQNRLMEDGSGDTTDSPPANQDPRTRSMPVSAAGLVLENGMLASSARRPGGRRSSLPIHGQAREWDQQGSVSSNGSSSSGLAAGAGPGAGSSIEAGVGGHDSIHNPARQSRPVEGQPSLRFVVLSRNPTNGTLGFCIQGGNSSGIYISQITDAAASRGEGPGGGLQVGDRILEVNGIVLSNATREMAASCLRQSTTSVLITVKNDMAGYQSITQPYDSLWLRSSFAFLANHTWELTFPKGSLLHIIDTMPKKTNHWEASLYDSKGRLTRQGMIPSRTGVKSGKLAGITGLDETGDPFSDAEPPPPPSSLPTQGTPSTVF